MKSQNWELHQGHREQEKRAQISKTETIKLTIEDDSCITSRVIYRHKVKKSVL